MTDNKYSLMSDREIIWYVGNNSLIHPFLNCKASEWNGQPVPSFGLSSFGYDVRLGSNFKTYSERDGFEGCLYPCTFIEEETIDIEADSWLYLAPGGFVLAHTIEYLSLPSHITGLVCDKSTYARLGIALQNTVLEAGWNGQITLEITNHGPRPVALRVGAGIAQVIFFRGQPCETPYSGKYQNQTGVTLPK